MNPNPEKAISQNNPEVGANNSMANAFEKLGVSPASFPAEPTREVVPEKPTRNKNHHKISNRNHGGPNHKADRAALSLELAEINKIRDRIKRDLARFEEDKNIANQEIAEIKTRIKEAEASGQPDAVIRWNARLEKAEDLLGMVEKTAPSVDPLSDVAIRRELYEYRRARQRQEGADSRINKGNDPRADEEYQQAQSEAFEIKEKIEALLKKRDKNLAIFNPAQVDSIGNIRTEGSALMREVQPEADPEELIQIKPEGSVPGSLELAKEEQAGKIEQGSRTVEDVRIITSPETLTEQSEGESRTKPELPPLESPVEEISTKTSEHLLRVEARMKEVSARQKEIAEKYDIASIEEKIELEKEAVSLMREKEKFAESAVSRETGLADEAIGYGMQDSDTARAIIAERHRIEAGSEKSTQATADNWQEEAVKNWEETSGKKVPDLELEHTPEEHDAILPIPTEVVSETVSIPQEKQKREPRPVLNAEQIIALNEKNRVTREKILEKIANEEKVAVERIEKSRMSSGLVRNTAIATALISILVVSVLPKHTNDFSSHRESSGKISQTAVTPVPIMTGAPASEITPPTAEKFDATLKSAENTAQMAGIDYVVKAEQGDSVWKMTAGIVAEKFPELSPEQQTYVTDAIKDRIEGYPESFGIEGSDADNLAVGENIDFGGVLNDKEFMDKVFSDAQNLTPEELTNIQNYNVDAPTETPAQAVSAGELFNQPLITDFAPPEPSTLTPSEIATPEALVAPNQTLPLAEASLAHANALVEAGTLKGHFSYSPSGAVDGFTVEGDVSSTDGHNLLNKHWQNVVRGHAVAGLGDTNISAVEGEAGKLSRYEHILDALKQKGAGASPEADFLKRHIDGIITNTEKTYGHVFKNIGDFSHGAEAVPAEVAPHDVSMENNVSAMPQEIMPGNTAELAQMEAYGDKVFLDDMRALFGENKGPWGIFGRTSGIDSPHMKDPDSGFLGKTINEILSAKPDTGVVGGTKTFGINNAEAHTKMVAYINNVRRVSGVGLNTSEKLADFVRNAAIVNAKLPK